mgnify:CR=1 FL=1
MTELNKDLILDTLKKVQDPSQSKDIVTLGLVGNITIKDSNVAVTLEVPVHRGASMEPIRKLAQQNILKIDDYNTQIDEIYDNIVVYTNFDGFYKDGSRWSKDAMINLLYPLR